jgi:AcrR family transcriptional regulator
MSDRHEADEGADGAPRPPGQYDLPVPETERGRQTRARLIEAAESVFGASGYERASITAITQAADVAQGTFYKYFPSKHAVFVELVIYFGVEMRRRLAAATSPLRSASRADMERAGLEAFFTLAIEHPGLYAIVREAQFVAPETYRWYYESFVTAYRRGFSSPGVDDPETVAWIVAGTADMLGLRWVVWEQRVPPPRVLDQVRALLDRGFRGIEDRGERS